jgi:hypothetical protein
MNSVGQGSEGPSTSQVCQWPIHLPVRLLAFGKPPECRGERGAIMNRHAGLKVPQHELHYSPVRSHVGDDVWRS